MSKFQIVIEMQNGAILFNSAEMDGGVDVFVDEFATNKEMRSIKVFRIVEGAENYRQVYQESRLPTSRPIGFGRW